MISGNSVCSATSTIFMPALRNVEAVPPVDKISTSLACKASARSMRPYLSETESNARFTRTISVIKKPNPLIKLSLAYHSRFKISQLHFFHTLVFITDTCFKRDSLIAI